MIAFENVLTLISLGFFRVDFSVLGFIIPTYHERYTCCECECFRIWNIFEISFEPKQQNGIFQQKRESLCQELGFESLQSRRVAKPFIHYSLLVTFYLLLVIFYSLLFNFYSFFVTFQSLLVTLHFSLVTITFIIYYLLLLFTFYQSDLQILTLFPFQSQL